jgi:hypothetical protein
MSWRLSSSINFGDIQIPYIYAEALQQYRQLANSPNIGAAARISSHSLELFGIPMDSFDSEVLNPSDSFPISSSNL